MTTALVIHGHFYQPPRENPWTEIVDREPSAHPFHDWNERVHSECYRPNAYARIVDSYGRVERVVNNYANINFNFGPTLLSWMERHHHADYLTILEADWESIRTRGGHGNAIAQAYNHAILPLSNKRDQQTQVRWGLADFRFRFGRQAESLWLPETACDDETLSLLIDEGLRYVILSPYQAARVRPLDGVGVDDWVNVSDETVDTTLAYKYFHADGSGRSIAVFFYDGPTARAIAFEGGLASSQALVDRFERAAAGRGRIVNVATDGETYGHHFRFGDRCLAYALEVEAQNRGFWVTNYGEFLDHYPPQMEVEISKGPDGEGTSWSCAHGVGRWRRDCGCQTGAKEGWNQRWRAPLREAVDFLRESAAKEFEEDAGEIFRDPWDARDAYIELIVDRTRSREDFLSRFAKKDLSSAEQVRALTLLELQRNAMTMYTSCGWFFADISGIETVQVLKYAARTMNLMSELGADAQRERFLEILSEAESNIKSYGNGADIFRRFAEPAAVSPQRVAAHLAITSLVNNQAKDGEIAGYDYRGIEFQRQHLGRLTLATGHVNLKSIATGRQFDFAGASIHFGDVDFYCVLKPFPGEEAFKESTEKLWTHFRTGSVPAILRLTQEEFGPEEFGLEHLLSGGRRRVSEIVFGRMVERFAESYKNLYEDNRRNIEMLQEAGFKLPEELRAAAEFTMGRRLEEAIRSHQQSQDPAAYQKALKIASEATEHGYRIDRTAVRKIFEEMIARTVSFTVNHPTEENLQAALTLIKLTKKLGLDASLEQAQEIVYLALHEDDLPVTDEMRELVGLLNLAPGLLQATTLQAEDERDASKAEATLS